VERARSAIGQSCIYRLGVGGMHPLNLVPWNQEHACDCSGFAAWALGVSRWLANPRRIHPWSGRFEGNWLETTAMVMNATRGDGVLKIVPDETAEPGDLIVYGDEAGHQGHIGIVSGTSPLVVIHCSAGNFRHFQDAIHETGPDVFIHHNALIVRAETVGAG